MELENTENCILCKQIINAYVNIPTSTCGISTMKVKISDHKKCKKLYEDLLNLKFKERVLMNHIADKQTEIMHFLHEKQFKDKML